MLTLILLISVLHFKKGYLEQPNDQHLFQVVDRDVPGNINNNPYLFNSFKIYNPTLNSNNGPTNSHSITNNIDEKGNNLINSQNNWNLAEKNNFKKSETPLNDLPEATYFSPTKTNYLINSCSINEHTLFKKYRILKYINDDETNMLFENKIYNKSLLNEERGHNSCELCTDQNQKHTSSHFDYMETFKAEETHQILKCSPTLIASTLNRGDSAEARLMSDYCLVHCASKNTKRDYIEESSAVESFLSTSWNWGKRFSSPIKMRSGRASVGIVVDSHFKNKPFIKRFAYQLANLFSSDSIIKLAHFGSCLGIIKAKDAILTQNKNKILRDFERLLQDDYIAQLQIADDKNIDFSLATMLYEINDNAKKIDTPMKIIFLVVNGKQKTASSYPHKIGEIAKRNNVKIYVIQFGDNYDLCHLTNITYPQRLFFLNNYKQVVLGGWVKPVDANDQVIHLKHGVLYEIQRTMLEWSKNLRYVKGDLVKVDKSVSAWESDLTKAAGLSSGNKIKSVLQNMKPHLFKRNQVTSQLLSHKSNYDKFKSTQHWSRIVKQWNYNTIRNTDNLFLVDTLRHPKFFMVQKLVYQLISLFPASLSKTTFRQLTQFREKYFINNKVFSVLEDIEKLTNEIPQYQGKGVITVPSILKATKESIVKRRRRKNNVVFLILTHNVLDFMGYNDLSKVVKGSQMKLYILGPGLSHQANVLGLLVPPSRLFLSPTLTSFFEPNMIQRLHSQLRRDFGALRGINHLTMDRISTRSRFYRNRPRRRRPNRKQTPRKRPTRRISIHRPKGWQRLKSLGLRASNAFKDVQERLNMNLRPQKRDLITSMRRGFNRSMITRFMDPFKRRPIEDNNINDISSPNRRARIGRRGGGRRRRRRTPNLASIHYANRKFNYGYKNMLAKSNTIILLDRNMGNSVKRRVKTTLYGIMKSFTKYDNYISIMVYGKQIKVVTTFRMFNNDEDINNILEKMLTLTRYKEKGRGKSSHLAEALFAAQDQFASGMPGLPKVLMVFMGGKSLDNFQLPSLSLLKSGVRVMAFDVKSRVPSNQALFLSGSKYLSFKMNPNHMIKSADRIIRILKSVCGGVNKRYQLPSGLSDSDIAKTWIWKNQKMFKLDFAFNPIEAAFLIDTTTSPDYNIKLAYNIIRLFDPYTRMSLDVLGLSGKLSRQLRLMTLYKSESQKMLSFQSLISNSVNKQINRIRRRWGGRKSRRDLIENTPKADINVDSKNIFKRSIGGYPFYRQQRHRGFSFKPRNTLAGKASVLGSSQIKRISNRYIGGSLGRTREIAARKHYQPSRKPNQVGATRENPLGNFRPFDGSSRSAINVKVPKTKNFKAPTAGRNYVDDASKVEIANLVNEMNMNDKKYRATNRPKLRKRIKRLRYRSRTLRNIIYYLRSRSNLFSQSKGHWPKVIFMILSRYPTDRYDRYIHSKIRRLKKISNHLKFQGIKLYTFLYTKRQKSYSTYDRLFRNISLRYYKIRYHSISRQFKRVQTEFASDFGYESKYAYNVEPFRKYYSSTGNAIFRRYADLEPPPTSSFLSVFGMQNVQNLKKLNRYDVVTNSISYEVISGFLNVLVAVDVSHKENFHVVRQTANEIIALFHTRRVRTTLMTYHRYFYPKYRYKKLPRGILAISKYNRRYIRTERYESQPNHQNLLRHIYRNILSDRYIRKRQTLLFVLSTKPSSTNAAYFANLIKNFGVTIVTVGIGHNYNQLELSNMASMDDLSFGCSESIIQNCVIRIRAALIQLLNKPMVRMTKFERFTLKHVSANTKYTPMMTLRGSYAIRHIQKPVTRQHFRIRTVNPERTANNRRTNPISNR